MRLEHRLICAAVWPPARWHDSLGGTMQSAMVCLGDATMPIPDQNSLIERFAIAFLQSLTHQQRERLRLALGGARPLSNDDLTAVPGLAALVSSRSDGGIQLDSNAHRALRELLSGSGLYAHSSAPKAVNPFMAITTGVESAQAWIATNVADPDEPDLNLGLFRVVLALKSGDFARADAQLAVLAEHFDVPNLEDCGPAYPPELSCVLFMKAIYADKDISEAALQRLFGLLASVPKDASLLRAILYNAILDVELRQQNMAEAEAAAHRALFHYNAAGEHGVTFYVHMYLALISLWGGEFGAADGRLKDARSALDDFEGAVPNDRLLLDSFEMIVGYETGRSGDFVAHLMRAGDTIPFGELWPSIAGPIISYGRRALAAKVTPAAALSWVRQWRVRQKRSQRFDALISAQEALALQAAGRWQEADEILADLGAARDVEVTIARFASGLDRAPRSTELARKIGESAAMADLSVRQAVAFRLMAAQSAVNRGMERQGARHLSAAIKVAEPSAHPALWDEMRGHVSSILHNRDLRGELKRLPRLQRQVDKLPTMDAPEKPDALTHQEFRVLQLLAEAQSNKAVAQRLGIALPTVKFHVKNLCRKTATRNRRDVVQAAITAGWLGSV